MSKISKSIGILSILTTMSMAEGMYFGGGLNNMDVGLDKNAIGFEAKIGNIFYNNFGIEGQISKTFSSAEQDVFGNNFKVDATAISVFATYSHQLAPQFTMMPKIGFAQYSMDASISSINEDDSKLGLAFGVDVKYKVNNNMNMYASFSKYYPNLDKPIATITVGNVIVASPRFNKTTPLHLSIGLEQKF